MAKQTQNGGAPQYGNPSGANPQTFQSGMMPSTPPRNISINPMAQPMDDGNVGFGTDMQTMGGSQGNRFDFRMRPDGYTPPSPNFDYWDKTLAEPEPNRPQRQADSSTYDGIMDDFNATGNYQQQDFSNNGGGTQQGRGGNQQAGGYLPELDNINEATNGANSVQGTGNYSQNMGSAGNQEAGMFGQLQNPNEARDGGNFDSRFGEFNSTGAQDSSRFNDSNFGQQGSQLNSNFDRNEFGQDSGGVNSRFGSDNFGDNSQFNDGNFNADPA